MWCIKLGTRLPGPGTIYSSQTLNFTKSINIGDIIKVTVIIAEKKENLNVVLNLFYLCNKTINKKEAFTESLGRMVGWWSLIINKPQ